MSRAENRVQLSFANGLPTAVTPRRQRLRGTLALIGLAFCPTWFFSSRRIVITALVGSALPPQRFLSTQCLVSADSYQLNASSPPVLIGSKNGVVRFRLPARQALAKSGSFSPSCVAHHIYEILIIAAQRYLLRQVTRHNARLCDKLRGSSASSIKNVPHNPRAEAETGAGAEQPQGRSGNWGWGGATAGPKRRLGLGRSNRGAEAETGAGGEVASRAHATVRTTWAKAREDREEQGAAPQPEYRPQA